MERFPQGQKGCDERDGKQSKGRHVRPFAVTDEHAEAGRMMQPGIVPPGGNKKKCRREQCGSSRRQPRRASRSGGDANEQVNTSNAEAVEESDVEMISAR